MDLEQELLNITGFDTRHFNFLKNDFRAFKSKTISKDNGKKRVLMVPCKDLKQVQRIVLDKYKSILNNNKYLKNQFAYMENKNNIKYANIHLRRKYIIKLDVEDYFNKITFSRTFGVLKKNGIEYKDALLISQLACYRDFEHHIAIAQGSPLSPFLSNLVSSSIDNRFEKYLKYYNDTKYSRYADDITISTNSIQTYIQLCSDLNSIYLFMKEIGFELNRSKTITIDKGKRKVGGIKINEKLNVERDFVDNIQLNLHYARIDYKKTRDKYNEIYKKKSNVNPDLFFRNSLIGKINYLSQVKGNSDSKVIKFKKMFNKIPEFCYQFDVRSEVEKSVFLLEFEIMNEKDGILPYVGTCFYLRNLGIVTCYHNFYDYINKNDRSLNITIRCKSKNNENTCYQTKINTDELKRIDYYKYDSDVYICDKNDYIFLSNKYLEILNKEYKDFIKDMEGFQICKETDPNYYKKLIEKEVNIYGYSNFIEREFEVSRLNIAVSNYLSSLHELSLIAPLGEGASGGPILYDGRVISVYTKGTENERNTKGRDLINLIDFLNAKHYKF